MMVHGSSVNTCCLFANGNQNLILVKLTVAIWTRLPKLPPKYYDMSILQKVGQKLAISSKLMLILTMPYEASMPEFVCMPVDQPLRTIVYIGDHAQQVIYEGINQILFPLWHLR